MLMVALRSWSCILLSQEVLLMLVMLVLRPESHEIGHGNCS